MMKDHDENLWEAYYTSMSEHHFYNFSVWPEGAKLWAAEGWESAVDTLYVNKDGPNFIDFLELKKFEIVVIRGRVMSDFQGKPWIDCFYVEPVGGPVYTDSSIEKLILGTTQKGDRFNAAATHSLERALEGTLPDEALFSAHFQLGDLYFQRATISRRVEDFQKAIDHFSDAADLDSSHEGASNGLKQAKAALERQVQINLQKEEEARKRQQELLEREQKRKEKKRDIEESYREDLRKKPK
jgi:tetratricopeptide (TPR) repeat protein